MLPIFYRFKVKNGTGQSITASNITVKGRRWKLASDGSLSTESAEASIYSNGGTITNGSYDSSSTQDNTGSSVKWFGGDFLFTVTAPTSASGDVTLYLERSTDGGTTWDDDGLGTPVAVLNFTASGTKKSSFSL